jgi:ribosomal protein S18 acetylase RimI-like enzyme
MSEMHIRLYRPTDHTALVALIAAFRVELAALRGAHREPNPAAAAAELQEYLAKEMPVFVAERPSGEIIGYLVCRVDGETVWAESLFVAPADRRQGVAGQLYAQAERLALERGSDTVYNWVHPNNDGIIAFLRQRGYDVLNLIEVRRPLPHETLTATLKAGDHLYRY